MIKGSRMTQEQRNALSIAHKGKASTTKGMHWKVADTSKMKGRVPWNKGLTKKTDARVKQYADKHNRQKRCPNCNSQTDTFSWKNAWRKNRQLMAPRKHRELIEKDKRALV